MTSEFIAAELKSTELGEVRDRAGFDHGAIIDTHRGQVTLLSESAHRDNHMVRRFEQVMSMDDEIACVTTTPLSDGIRVSLTFKATVKTEKRDRTEFLTSLARRGDMITAESDEIGLELNPLNSREVGSLAEKAWGSSWPPVAATGKVNYDHIFIADTVAVASEIDIDEELHDHLSEIAFKESWLTYTHITRPAILGTGLRLGLIVVRGATLNEANYRIGEIISGLKPPQRLRFHRLFGRQRMGTLAGAGLGILPWQHIKAEVMP